ncbi:MAG: ribonuclease R [Bacteroidales bacterium]|nr:ribonuclease R [Bacteroidales bacterium]
MSKRKGTNILNLVKGFFNNNPTRCLNYKQVSKQLQITNVSEKYEVLYALEELAKQDILEEVSRGKYRLKSETGIIIGNIQINAHGIGTVIDEQTGKEIQIYPRYLNKALPGDKVKVRLFAQKKTGILEGVVLEVLERSQKLIVGTIEVTHSFAFLVTDPRIYPYDIYIPKDLLKNAQQGQKVVVKIVEWGERSKNPIGEVVDVLGFAGEHQTEIHAILAEFNLPYKFPKEVEDAAQEIPIEIPKEEYIKRRDFREVTTFTIDPEDAKDFDDALSIRMLERGLWEIGIHIADVSYYVHENSIIDKEAFKRATSIYLVDRVIPMLPEKLSNYVCSLRPNEEKLCFSAVFVVDEGMNIKEEWFGKTIIRSNRRFTYEEAQNILDKGEGDFCQELQQLQTFARMLREERMKKGAMAFDKVEVKFKLDENGKPLSVYFKETKESNKLIEEFMLLANRKVAEYLGKKKGSVFVYRIHDKPDPEKLRQFRLFAKQWGFEISLRSQQHFVSSINKMLDEIKYKPERDIIENMAIRSMAKAVYSTKNIGHYGLAFDYYTHFTSPIRRYPDLMVHRILNKYLTEKQFVNRNDEWEQRCKHSTEMELLAADAERASIKYKQIEFMADKVGQKFEGFISGITEWGIYVQLIENKAEGMISLRTLDDDFYIYDEERMEVVGKRYKKRFKIGDRVAVEVVKINLEKRHLDFKLV